MQNFASDCFLCTGNGGNGRKIKKRKKETEGKDCFLCTGNGGNGRKTVSACLAHGEVHEHSVLAK